MSPKVSVIIPVHNTIQYLPKCLDSVCSQTLKEIEIICINDCSNDGSEMLLRDYAEADGRFVLIDFDRNRGVSAARNAGIEAARGEYISFVDSDDRISPDFLEKLYSAANGADIVKGKTKRMKDDVPCDDIAVDFFDDNRKIRADRGNFFLHFFSAIYRRTFIEEYRLRFYEDLSYAEDVTFLVQAVSRSSGFECIDDVWYYYVLNENSSMSCNLNDNFRFFHSELIAVDRIADYLNSTCSDSALYDSQFQKIVTLARLNMTYFSFSDDFKNQWIDHVLAKYNGSGDVNAVYHTAEKEYREFAKKCQLAMIRGRMNHNLNLDCK